jgi:hypothetical protein
LEDAGLIEVVIGGGRGKSNSYQITTNGMGKKAGHKSPEQDTPNKVHPLAAEKGEQSDHKPRTTVHPLSMEKGEQSDIKGEQNDAKGRTPVHPNPIEPSIEQYCAEDLAKRDDSDFDRIFAACPRKGDWEATENAVLAEIEEGAKPADLLAAAKAYAKEQAGNEKRFVKLSENFFADGVWKRYRNSAENGEAVDEALVLQHRAEAILAKKPWVASMRPSEFGPCILSGLVTAADCRAAGILSA